MSSNPALEKNSLLYLRNIASALPENKCISTILKSQYLRRSRVLEIRQNVVSSKSLRCNKCFIPNSEQLKSYKVVPETKLNRFARRVLSKVSSDEPLTKYQRRYVKKLKAQSKNTLVTTCNVCKTETKEYLNKPTKVTKIESLPKIASKKKKRKKDKFSGLNPEAVLASSTKLAKNNPVSSKKPSVALTSQNNSSNVSKHKNKKVEQQRLKKEQSKAKDRLMKINSILNDNKKGNNSLASFLKTL